MTETYRKRLGWKVGTCVFVVLPTATLLLGTLIVQATGGSAPWFWNITSPGPGILVAILAAGFLLAFHVAPRVTLPLSILAGASWYVCAVVVFIAGVMVDPNSLH